MSCCDYKCDQGRNCPVRTAKEMAITEPEPLPLGTWESIGAYGLMVFFSLLAFACIAGLVNYLSGSFA